MVPARTRILLRLDDGSLIGSPAVLKANSSLSAVLVSVDDAARLGRIGEKEVVRLSLLLSRAKALNGSAADVEVHEVTDTGVKRSSSHLIDQPPSKRCCLPANGGASPTPSASGKALPGVFKQCAKLLAMVFKKLGNYKNTFYFPVDPTVAPNYYEIIKKPMCLQQVESKLKNGEYGSAFDFAQDVRQVWINCKTYNRAGDWVHSAGTSAQDYFEKIWNDSGLDGAVTGPVKPVSAVPQLKRENSMAVTSDYQDSQGDFGPANPRRSRRPRVPNRRLSSPSMDTSAEGGGLLPGMPSSAVGLAATAEGPAWGAARLAELQKQLGLLQEQSPDVMEAMQNIILSDPAYASTDPSSTDEITLVFEVLAPPTLDSLEALVQQHMFGKPAPLPPASVNPSPHSTQTSMQQQQTVASMPIERKQQLMQALHVLDPDDSPKLFEVLRSSGVPIDSTDFELDLSLLDDSVLWKLDNFVKQTLGSKYPVDGNVDESSDSSDDEEEDD